jgi:hypothetical protein
VQLEKLIDHLGGCPEVTLLLGLFLQEHAFGAVPKSPGERG